MVSVTEDGVEQVLLVVKSFKDNKTETPTIHWDYGDRCNAYFLIGVLEVIKQELVEQIARTTEPDD